MLPPRVTRPEREAGGSSLSTSDVRNKWRGFYKLMTKTALTVPTATKAFLVEIANAYHRFG